MLISLQDYLLATSWAGEIFVRNNVLFLLSLLGAGEPAALLLLASSSSCFCHVWTTCRAFSSLCTIPPSSGAIACANRFLESNFDAAPDGSDFNVALEAAGGSLWFTEEHESSDRGGFGAGRFAI